MRSVLNRRLRVELIVIVTMAVIVQLRMIVFDVFPAFSVGLAEDVTS
jgi:hypothetical protein